MGCCGSESSTDVQLEKTNKRRIVSQYHDSGISDKEAWKKVDDLWKMHRLRNDETMKLDKARPFIESYIK